ncbi:hypothetical protein C731_1330 [Mycolicibacterium hassiacum DSM 44199]|uniref:Outer membrane channel protein CpnT-like N-terminal domain-containing protein n=2 Tax=Mycolicibacterium hassiacum TaxID=46351 RepID=K5B912_MYCHD|nr:hypothetical protein C731_1330 [Mycolicibacterium hassiacum DSM 44199]
MDALRAVLSSGLASGVDLPGINMAFAYGNGAQEFSNGLAVAANALKAAGIKLQATGHNYANADTISTIGGAAPTGSADTDFDKTDPAEAKRFPNSSIVPPPAAWYVVEHLIPIVNPLGAPGASWPSGNPSMLRLTAWQWRNLANGFQPLSDRLRRGKTAVSTQKIPESSRIADMYDDLADGLAALAGLANEIATKIESFAQQVQETQDAIRRLLDRLSPGGLLDTIKGIFTGDADDTLIQVARDIRTVLENQQRQVKAIVEALGHLTTEIGDAASRFQNWADKNLRELLGDQVGGVISGALTFYIDFRVGELTGLINSVAGTIALADVDTWIAMGETTLGIIQDPSTLDDFLITVGKEFIAWDELTGDHPGRGVGEAAFNIASLFTPGGGATKGGIVAKGVNQFRKAFGKLDLPSFKGPSFGSNFDGSLSINGSKVPDVPEVKPGLPESVITPGPFNRIDTPGHPVDAGVPSRPIDPPGSSSRPPVTGTAHPPGGRGRPASPATSTPRRTLRYRAAHQHTSSTRTQHHRCAPTGAAGCRATRAHQHPTRLHPTRRPHATPARTPNNTTHNPLRRAAHTGRYRSASSNPRTCLGEPARGRTRTRAPHWRRRRLRPLRHRSQQQPPTGSRPNTPPDRPNTHPHRTPPHQRRRTPSRPQPQRRTHRSIRTPHTTPRPPTNPSPPRQRWHLRSPARATTHPPHPTPQGQPTALSTHTPLPARHPAPTPHAHTTRTAPHPANPPHRPHPSSRFMSKRPQATHLGHRQSTTTESVPPIPSGRTTPPHATQPLTVTRTSPPATDPATTTAVVERRTTARAALIARWTAPPAPQDPNRNQANGFLM